MKFINCIHCGAERRVKFSSSANIFCNQKCQAEYKLRNNQLPRFYKGEISDRRSIKRILVHLFGDKCTDCGQLPEHNGKLLSMQVEHIDGNAGNDMPDNVKLLCPNCHSQTSTFGARNKGNGRRSRKLPR